MIADFQSPKILCWTAQLAGASFRAVTRVHRVPRRFEANKFVRIVEADTVPWASKAVAERQTLTPKFSNGLPGGSKIGTGNTDRATDAWRMEHGERPMFAIGSRR